MYQLLAGLGMDALQGKKKAQEEKKRQQMAALQGASMQYPGQQQQSDDKGNILGSALGMLGGLKGEKKPDAMGQVDDALDSYDAYKGQDELLDL